MKKSIIVSAAICAAGSMAAHSPLQTPSAGSIDRHYIYSPELQDTVTVDVWMPEIYKTDSEVHLPALYMHDGQNLFDASTTWNSQSWEMDSVVSLLAEKKGMTPPVIIGVHSVAATRVGDLMPARPLNNNTALKDSALSIMGEKGLRGDAYAGFIVNTLRPQIEANYRVLTGPENTAVMGSSMGGLMSMYLMCEYPDLFGSAACLSTHWIGRVEDMEKGDYRFPEAMLSYLAESLPRDGKHRIYFDHGTETLDAWYGDWDEKAVSTALRLGYTKPDRLGSYTDKGGRHEESTWMKRVHIPLMFLYGR